MKNIIGYLLKIPNQIGAHSPSKIQLISISSHQDAIKIVSCMPPLEVIKSQRPPSRNNEIL